MLKADSIMILYKTIDNYSMAIRLAVIVVTLLSLALLAPLVITEAYAKGPIYDADHTFGLMLRMIVLPAAAASGGLVVFALYVRQR